MKKNIILQLLFLGMLFSNLVGIEQANASELKFSVDPILPENQIDNSHTYFDLLVKPEQKQKLTIHMKNTTKKPVTVETTVNAATTNLNGVVEYGDSNTSIDETAPYNIEELVKPDEKEVTIPAGTEKDANFTVTIPSKSYEGVLAGGITLQEKDAKTVSSEQKSNQGLAIENKYAYVVAVLLSESSNPIKSDLQLTKVEPGQVNARNTINTTIKNTKSKYENKINIQTKIRKKGSDDVLYHSEKEDMQIAPNTSLVYPTKLNGEKMEAGDYELEMDVSNNQQTWNFVKTFHIKGTTAEQFNKNDVSIKKSSTPKYYFIAGFIILVVLILVIFYLKRKKKNSNHCE